MDALLFILVNVQNATYIIKNTVKLFQLGI